MKAGGSFILPRALAPGGFALAQACAADHFVLGRVIAKGTLDGIAGTLGLVPQGFHLGIAQGALLGELRLEGRNLRFRGHHRREVGGEARGRQRAKGWNRGDLVPAIQQALGLLDHIRWKGSSYHFVSVTP